MLTELSPELAAELKTLPTELDYNLHVKPILLDKCFVAMARIKPNKKRAYAGHCRGSLCSIGRKPRQSSDCQRQFAPQ